jgi:hypothetical protein
MRIKDYQRKIDHLLNTFQEVKKIDPYNANTIIMDMKKNLIQSGFYKCTPNHITDETIIRLIMACQGKKKRNNNTKYKS